MLNNIIGIYKIENLINKKCYIGSSMNIGDRWKRHLRHFKYKNHKNKHLMSAWEKYGASNFTFSILESFETISIKELQSKEEDYINKYEFDKLYNKTKLGCGGSDVIAIPCYVLDLHGNILSEHCSLSHAARFYNTKQISKTAINTGSIYNKKYRIVTPDFYKTNLEKIKSWNPYSCKSAYKSLLYNNTFFILQKDDIILKYKTSKEVANKLQITQQAINQMINSENYKLQDQIFHKRSGYTLKKRVMM